MIVAGDVDPDKGFLIDYGDIKKAFAPIEAALDHQYLNDIQGLENPTSEMLAVWIWERLVQALPLLDSIVVHETCTSRCEYAGPGSKTSS